jgi:hypothetical protein
MSDFLRKVEVQDDYDWEVVENLAAKHPDLLGYQEMDIEMSRVFGISKSVLMNHALRLCSGDEAAAEAELEDFLQGAETVSMEAGRLHLYVENLSSKTRAKDALPAFNAISGRSDEDLIFVLSDHPLDFGSDPHTMSTMRALPPAPDDPVFTP